MAISQASLFERVCSRSILQPTRNWRGSKSERLARSPLPPGMKSRRARINAYDGHAGDAAARR